MRSRPIRGGDPESAGATPRAYADRARIPCRNPEALRHRAGLTIWLQKLWKTETIRPRNFSNDPLLLVCITNGWAVVAHPDAAYGAITSH